MTLAFKPASSPSAPKPKPKSLRMWRKPMKRALLLTTLAPALLMTSACGQRETPRSVSDLCLNDREVKYGVAPAPGVDDPGNQYDTDQTVKDLIEHNAVWRKLCEKP